MRSAVHRLSLPLPREMGRTVTPKQRRTAARAKWTEDIVRRLKLKPLADTHREFKDAMNGNHRKPKGQR